MIIRISKTILYLSFFTVRFLTALSGMEIGNKDNPEKGYSCHQELKKNEAFGERLSSTKPLRQFLQQDVPLMGRYACRGTFLGVGCFMTAYALGITKRDVPYRLPFVASLLLLGTSALYLSPRTSPNITYGLLLATVGILENHHKSLLCFDGPRE